MNIQILRMNNMKMKLIFNFITLFQAYIIKMENMNQIIKDLLMKNFKLKTKQVWKYLIKSKIKNTQHFKINPIECSTLIPYLQNSINFNQLLMIQSMIITQIPIQIWKVRFVTITNRNIFL